MFNRRIGLLGIAAAAMAAVMPSIGAGALFGDAVAEQTIENVRPTRKKRKAYTASVSPQWRRGKRAQAKPRKRKNMRTVSKRVRRKHRRAA